MAKNQTYYIERKKSLWEKTMSLICQKIGHRFAPLPEKVYNYYAHPDRKCSRCGEERLGKNQVVIGHAYDWSIGDGFFLRLEGSKHSIYQRRIMAKG